MAARTRLYQVPPGEFVKARDALVRELRGKGEEEEARSVAALRKPPAALWIANQLGREAKEEVEALIEATRALRAAQSGGGGDALRDAMRAQREALQKLADAAARAAGAGGIRSTLELQRRVQATVQSAALQDPEALREGALAEELAPAGFETLLGTAPAAPPPARKEPPPPGRPSGAKDERAGAAAAAREERARAAAEEKERARLASELRAAEETARKLAAAAEKAEREAAQAEESAAKARARAQEARHKADQAAARALELKRG
jgi:hypothetical protein